MTVSGKEARLVILLAMDQHIPSKICSSVFVCFAGYVLVRGKNGGIAKWVWAGEQVFNHRDTPWQLLSIAQPGCYCPAINAGAINYQS